ncbi:MAG: hypothetical protein DLM60_23020 [Pseudonocardiales bacterium]|nr:MAG: hypothetical protein DLM60_23020 [Pseudonocardiales bacterium]
MNTERLHERRAEGIGPAERLAVAIGEEHVAGGAGEVVGPPEGAGDALGRGRVAWAEDALLGDQLEVAILQGDRGEPPVPVGQLVLERQRLGTGALDPDQLAQVALARDETDDRHCPVCVGGLDELGDLLGFPCDECRIGDLPGEPEHELVEEQDHTVVAEALGVRADRREPGVEWHERISCARDRVDIARQEHRNDVTDQPLGKLRVG